jgi:dTDP-4-dehydrorhamnose reductase
MLPHRLAALCKASAARLIHISTDCVFSGREGMYSEEHVADAQDLYGRSKLLGEVNAAQAITLRTSLIGPELNSAHGLLGWFLSQQSRVTSVRGFSRAIFSGLTTVELARVIRDFILPNADLHGIYHVSSEPISKYALLALIARAYRVDVRIDPDESVVIDRSLDSSRFRQVTGYQAPPWTELVRAMHAYG